MGCSIWIDDRLENKKGLIEKILDYDGSDCLYEGHEVDELYIERDGALEGFINVGEIGVGINIPFEEWFGLFKKYKAFDELRQQIEKRILEQEVTLTELKNMFAYHVDSSEQTIMEE